MEVQLLAVEVVLLAATLKKRKKQLNTKLWEMLNLLNSKRKMQMLLSSQAALQLVQKSKKRKLLWMIKHCRAERKTKMFKFTIVSQDLSIQPYLMAKLIWATF